jgi:uncharacterized membrane protein YhaH (DUF805 family)
MGDPFTFTGSNSGTSNAHNSQAAVVVGVVPALRTLSAAIETLKETDERARSYMQEQTSPTPALPLQSPAPSAPTSNPLPSRRNRMTDSPKLRTLSGWAILLLGIVLFAASFIPVVARGGIPTAAGMIGLFGLLAVGVGYPFATATAQRLMEGAARNLCVGLESLMLGAAGGVLGLFLQHSSFSLLDPLPATLVVVFVALFGFTALARVATARQGSAAFRSRSEGLFSFGGSIGPVSFLMLQPPLLVLAAVAGRMIAAQAGDSREGSILALALSFAVLPIFLRAELALCVKRRRDATGAWPSYGVLAWAALLGLVTFPEICRWLLSLPGAFLASNPLPAWPQTSLVQVLGFLVSLAACVSCYMASGRTRRGFCLRTAGYIAFGLGSLLPISVGLASAGVQQVPPLPITIVLAMMIILPAGLIIPARHLLFVREEKSGVHEAQGACPGVTSLCSG